MKDVVPDRPPATLRSRARQLLAPLLVSLAVVVALLPATRTVFSADDAYVLAHLQSPVWRVRLFPYNVDRPSENVGAWWDGVRYQRRFVRLLPSALMAAEVSMLGQRPQPLHLASLALHLINVLLIYWLARRWLKHDGKAALVAAIFGVHPVALEPVSWFATQPLLVATTCTLLAVEWWIRYRSGAGWPWLAAALVAVFATVTSYESAVAVPLIVAAGDAVLLRSDRNAGARWLPRMALVSLLMPYLLLVEWNRAGAAALETSHRPTVRQAWTVARIDLANYLFKALGLVHPNRPHDYWIYNALGESAALAVLAAVLLPVAWWARRRPLALLGLLAFFALLGPPWLVRATVGTLNIPSLRAVYLPLLGLAAVVTAALSTARFRKAAAIVVPLLIAACVVDWQPHQGVGFGGTTQGSVLARRLLAGTDPAMPVVVVGGFGDVPKRRGCLYQVNLDWPGRIELRLVPPARSGAVPHLTRTGERTFTATASDGLFLPLRSEPVPIAPRAAAAGYNPGGFRLRREPPPAVLEGRQQLAGATVEVAARDAEAIRSLRFTLDRPLDEYVFLAVEGCDQGRQAVFDRAGPTALPVR